MMKYLSNPDIIAVINEGTSSKIQGAKFKKMGRRKGHTDLYLHWTIQNITFFFWLELKAEDGSLKKEQKIFLKNLPNSFNTYKGVAWSLAEGRDLIIRAIDNSYQKMINNRKYI